MYTQSFPDKYLSGWYEFKATALRSSISNRGKFTLDLCKTAIHTTILPSNNLDMMQYNYSIIILPFLFLDDLVQTTVITRRPGEKIRVSVDVQKIGDLKLHISNLLYGHKMLENILDKIINGTWQPGFVVTRRLINDLVSAAFTEGFHKSFHNFPFEKIIKPKPIAGWREFWFKNGTITNKSTYFGKILRRIFYSILVQLWYIRTLDLTVAFLEKNLTKNLLEIPLKVLHHRSIYLIVDVHQLPWI